MTDVLNVTLREETGTKLARRLRRDGLTPAILYGHGEQNVNLSIPTAEVESAIRHGHKMVGLSGGVSEKALIRAIQWDSFGTQILHLDLNRVSETEAVVVSVPLELRGEAPGAKLGGIVEHQLYDVEIECPAGQIPEKLSVSIRELGVGDSILLKEVEMPENVTALTPGDTTVVLCQAQLQEEEEEQEGEVASAAEPEVIGRKAEDEGEGGAD